MTQLAATEPYSTRFSTEVVAIDGRTVRLATSYFYAESGGQPADRGTIGDVSVVDVQEVDGEHVHTLAEDPSFREGQEVLCDVDWTYRTYCMRAHTASHVLYGAGRRLLDDLGYGGFGIDDEKVRVDFETTSQIDDETLVELERLVNQVVWESRSVSWEEVPLETVREDEFVSFNTKTEAGVFDESDEVRIVTIGEGEVVPGEPSDGPWDVAACGGTHVRDTREIGPVTLLSRSNPGEGLTRVEFAVGPKGIDHRATEKAALFDASRALETSPDAVPAAAQSLREQLSDCEAELSSLRGTLVEARLAAFEPFERDGATWLAGTIDGVGPNDVREQVEASAGEAADVVVVAGDAGGTFVVVAAGAGDDAASVVDAITEAHGGGGGGSSGFAQCGGITASPATVVADLRSE
ncbi:alanyl-tRNA editing protein [Haloarchaeobius sp. DFWS5]|uniref:alanyl-tRNA editing protein n=1 Tax=Haloarchaeobius sp. DFWS5 TaxID=3446114 RepID=UPI003EB8D1AF